MANHYLNVMRFSGPAHVVEGILDAAESADGPLAFAALVPVPSVRDPSKWMSDNWGTGEPEDGVEPPVRYEERGLHVGAFTFSTLGGMPAGFAAAVAAANPDVVVTLASVDPDGGDARAMAWRGTRAWSMTLGSSEFEALRDPEADSVEEGAVLDRLDAAMAGAVSDLEDGLAPSFSPT